MEEALEERLARCGVPVAETLTRFCGNEVLYFRFLRRFPEDPSYGMLEQALKQANHADAAAACHTLKGVSGNLGLMPLYEACNACMPCLRQASSDGLDTPLAALRTAYADAVTLARSLEA